MCDDFQPPENEDNPLSKEDTQLMKLDASQDGDTRIPSCVSDLSKSDLVAYSHFGLRQSFSDLAVHLINLTPIRAAKYRHFYLDQASVDITDELIGSSATSEVFRGFLDGRPVAVKRLRIDVSQGKNAENELRVLVMEIDFMCR